LTARHGPIITMGSDVQSGSPLRSAI
jgi:hypothetical protein